MITDMKNRIRELMDKKGMSQKIFAQELKLGEATVSGIFNGRTNPSMATVHAIHNRFPEVNVQWLMFGDGDMFNSDVAIDGQTAASGAGMDHNMSPDDASAAGYGDYANGLFAGMPAEGQSATPASAVSPAQRGALGHDQGSQIRVIEKYLDKPQRKITEIRIFFDDGTYETFTK